MGRGRTSSSAGPGELSLGTVVGVYGTRGELRIHLHDRTSTLLHSGGDVVLCGPDGERRPVKMTTRAGSGGRVLARVTPPVRGRDAALALKDWEIVADEGILPALDEGEYYHRDLLGLSVEDASGTVFGELLEIHEAGPIDIWTVSGPDGGRFVPALADNIVAVDVPGGRVILRDGLLE